MQLNTDRCVFHQQYGKTGCAAYLVSQGADVNSTWKPYNVTHVSESV